MNGGASGIQLVTRAVQGPVSILLLGFAFRYQSSHRYESLNLESACQLTIYSACVKDESWAWWIERGAKPMDLLEPAQIKSEVESMNSHEKHQEALIVLKFVNGAIDKQNLQLHQFGS